MRWRPVTGVAEGMAQEWSGEAVGGCVTEHETRVQQQHGQLSSGRRAALAEQLPSS